MKYKSISTGIFLFLKTEDHHFRVNYRLLNKGHLCFLSLICIVKKKKNKKHTNLHTQRKPHQQPKT